MVNQPVQVTDAWTGAGYHGYWDTDLTAIGPRLGNDANAENAIATVDAAAGSGAVLEDSADPAFADASFDDTTGTFTVPARTVAVFLS